MAIAVSKPTGLISRLHAWWEGYDAADQEILSASSSGNVDLGTSVDLAGAAELDAGQGDGGNTARIWTKERVAAVQLVCGEGSSFPGGERFTKTVIKPLGLNETMSVLIYGAQLGLYARVVARETGAWADAQEADPVLAEEATRLSQAANLAKKAVIFNGTPAEAGIKDASRDTVIAVEALHRTPDLGGQLRFIARALKPSGQLLLIDFVRKSSVATTPAIDLWRAHEPAPPDVHAQDELREALKAQEFTIRATADLTDDYCANLMQGLQGMAKQLVKHPPESAMHVALLREVNFWGRRLAVLQAGDIGIVRIIAGIDKE